MRSATVVAALAAGASATHYAQGNGTVSYTTEVLTAYTTYCPASTTIVHGSETYTVTEATTLTITNCPCTVTKPVITSPVVYCSTCPTTTPVAPTSPIETHPVPVSSETPVVPVSSETPVVPVSSETPVVPVSSETPVVPVSSETLVVPIGTAPVIPSSSPGPYPTTSAIYVNSTAPAPTGGVPTGPGPVVSVSTGSAPVGTAPGGSATTTSPAAFTGAANKMAASGASLAGLLGLAAYLL